ncbi:CPBP family intramembrane glutamic endopeptidase [Radiobacillus deserti]|uniref:CPBP family intramembrane glutamic endopeptidase n=1 Tax=Radiobacillus deserti TaxID=2594883 RepID=UPI00389B0A7D
MISNSRTKKYCSRIIANVQLKNLNHYLTVFKSFFLLFLYLLFLNALIISFHLEPDVKVELLEPKTNSFISYVLGTVFLSPIWEEFLFRGMIYSKLTEVFSKKSSILLSATLFMCIHPISLINSPYIFLVGIVTSYTYSKTNNILVPIFIHSINNFLTIFLAF